MANAQIPEIAAINDFDNVVTTLRYPSGEWEQLAHPCFKILYKYIEKFGERPRFRY